MSKNDRDAYDLPETPERKLVLRMVMEKKIHTWAGDAVSNDSNAPLAPNLQLAFHDLTRAGLVRGENFTGRGYAAAVDWGVLQPARGRRS